MVVAENDFVGDRDSQGFQEVEESFRFGNAGECGDRRVGQFRDREDLAVVTDSVDDGFDFEGRQSQVCCPTPGNHLNAGCMRALDCAPRFPPSPFGE